MESNPSFDMNSFKAAMRSQWDRSAAGWDDHTGDIRAWLREATAAMIEMAGVRAGDRVLDVAAGSGDQAIDLAARVGPAGTVLATDLSPVILARAQAHAQRLGLSQVRTQVADGEALPLPDASFDAAVCRLGLMLFPDPLAGLREMRRVVRAGGGHCSMVFSQPQANPCIALAMRTALRHAGLPAPDPARAGGLFSLGAPGQLEALMRQAGWREVATTRLAAPFRLPSARHYVGFLRTAAGPIQQVLERLDASAQSAAWDDIEAQLHAFDTAEGWCGPNELLLAAGRH